jgi:glucose-specific phosphotransferase system IIA component
MMNTSIPRDSNSVNITLIAPLSGPLVPIERVPDPVFAQKMVGDGISIDPLDQCLRAPCDGEITQLHPAGHAVTVTTPQGIEVLMHIGLDTVGLKGTGFTARVQPGDAVQTGDALIDFDADYIATHAKSLLTQIVIANSERVATFAPRSGQVTAGQDVILDLTLAGGSVEENRRHGQGNHLRSDHHSQSHWFARPPGGGAGQPRQEVQGRGPHPKR